VAARFKFFRDVRNYTCYFSVYPYGIISLWSLTVTSTNQVMKDRKRSTILLNGLVRRGLVSNIPSNKIEEREKLSFFVFA